jgi:hypothetical protein
MGIKTTFNLNDCFKRLFFSRHFLIYAAGLFALFFNKINGNEFCLLMLYVLGTSSIDKFKDNFKFGGK